MDVNTGHLIANDHPDFEKLIDTGRYMPIPQRLEHAAKLKLAGKKEAMVSLTSGGKLSQFAASERKKHKRWKKYKKVSGQK